ncbi:MAG TPA: sugar phosphate isomerase/epimerase [Clostridiales bacterium]|nr:sugar phosphate isomerase/epimerase [Clostridiales bacterium]
MGKIGLQLYSIKELTQKDFLGTLQQVASIGYDGVEFAGFFDTPAPQLRSVLNAYGLNARGSHTGINLLVKDLEGVIEYNLEIGNPYVICPGLSEEMRNSSDAWKETAELFNNIGSKCKKNGIQFGYHNHAIEFEKFNGEYGYDILAENTDPNLVCLEIDTYWVEYAGLKSIDFMKKYSNRLPLLHIKELKSFSEKESTEIGKGVMNFKEITDLGKKYGTEWYIVEQEHFDIPQLQSIEESLKYLRGII